MPGKTVKRELKTHGRLDVGLGMKQRDTDKLDTGLSRDLCTTTEIEVI